MEALLTSENLIALLTLASLEIVLGIDNIVFIAILTANVAKEKQKLARQVGLAMAMVMRILLLLCLSWLMGLTEPLFELLGQGFSGRDLILALGGLFLIAKSTLEIHKKIEKDDENASASGKVTTFGAAIVQIALIDIVFSLDSVITAIGMADSIAIMVIAIIIAVGVMFVFADSVSAFIEEHPTVKMLALSFLLLIGVMLVAEGCGKHVDKGYIYFAMAFSLFVELLNLKVRKRKL